MIFLSDTNWWLLFVLETIMILGLAYREAFRFKILTSSYGRLITYLAILAAIFWFSMVILMAFYSGIFSALIGFLSTIIIGIATLKFIKLQYVNHVQEFIAESEWKEKNEELVLARSVNNKEIRMVMKEHSIGVSDIEELFRRLGRTGIEQTKVNSAILNPQLVAWYFNKIKDPSTNLEDLAIELAIYARCGKKP
jgi:hypothetical protein